jgi:enterochelin esterase family protein
VDLCCSQTFADFVCKDVVQWARKNYHVSSDPKRAIIGGASFGGLMASYCALHHSDVFGNVLSQSGAYQWYPGTLESDQTRIPEAEPGWLTREFVATPRREIRFYLEAGRYEDGGFASLLPENRRFRDALLGKGYAVTWSQFEGGHDFVGWRGSFADGLMALTAGSENK